ncbi:MAG TPA: hypothetical protein IAA52_12185 [Candidatus Pullichristensenella stercorigallinarum]|uniref:Uncharacterized protein n=1 Tax=Candidatus Pullichristensenella stercorigallinarum TaxID=2840909 RepID=A0A9D1CXH1_9FIRM|nr:hypothetical protein [Candidatus Pullichristensenella stercorigallinarum]
MSEGNAPRKLHKGIIALIVIVAVAIIAVAVYLLTADGRAYSRAVELQAAGNYDEALAVYQTIPEYEDAAERIRECSYQMALAREAAGNYAEAQALYAWLGDYLDAAERGAECGYRAAVALETTGSAADAAAGFAALGNYKDSAARAANLQSALERYNTERERVEAQTEALETALATGEALLETGGTPLDATTLSELQACVDEANAARVEAPAAASTLDEVEAAASALARIDYAAVTLALEEAATAYADSAARYALVDAPEPEFVLDRLARMPEISRIVAETDVLAAEEAGNAEAAEEVADEAGSAEAPEEATEPAEETGIEPSAEEAPAEEAAEEADGTEAAEEAAEPSEETSIEPSVEEAPAEEVAEEADGAEAPEEATEPAEETAIEPSAEEAPAEEAADEADSTEAPEEATEPAGETGEAPEAAGEPVERVYFASALLSEAFAHLSDEELLAAGAECGGSVEIYATADEARQRDAGLAESGAASGSHAAVGTLVVRVSEALPSAQRQEFLAQVIDALTTSEPGEAVEREELAQGIAGLLHVQEIGFTVSEGRLYYALVLANDLVNTAVEFPRLRVSFYDEAGELILTDEAVRMAICPGQEIAWASTIWDVEETPASATAELIRPEVYNLADGVVACAPLEVLESSVSVEDGAATLQCEIRNPNAADVSAASVTILYRDGEGALVAGENGYTPAIPAGETISFTMPLNASLVTDNYQVYVDLG